MRRLRLSRRCWWRLPPNARSVAYPTRWANPFRPHHRNLEANRAAVETFSHWLTSQPDLVAAARQELTGRDHACWCPLDLPCHADVWLALLDQAPRATLTGPHGGAANPVRATTRPVPMPNIPPE